MKLYTLLLVLLGLAIQPVLHAQKKTTVSPCFHDELIHYQNIQTPYFRDGLDKTYRNLLNNKSLQTRGSAVYTIKVVFHIVYKNENENISNTRINDQIAVLNNNFRRKNVDTSNTRAVFKPFAADANIEFKLDRVIRVKTAALFKPDLLSQTNQIPNQVKSAAQGGSNAVDPDRYLNIWVCKIEPMEIFGLQAGAVLGFSYPPAGLSNWPDGANAPSKDLDGVVVDYRTVGKAGLTYEYPGRTDALNLQGRTMVHEIGHYLGLRHVWGDASFLGLNPNCDGEDGISDTPKAANQSEFDCDQTKNSCVDAPTDYPDMIENFMDYSEESCQNMFTFGQVGIMRSVLEGPRKLLIQELSASKDIVTQFNATLSPNPAYKNVYFDWKENQPFDVSISDALGRNLKNIKGNSAQEVDLSTFNAGIYFFKVQSSGRYQVIKLVLN